MSRAICGICMCLEDETGCGCQKETEMNNEPVAWVDEIWITRPDLARNIGIQNMFMRSAEGVKNYIPLYTHLAKTLTDDELFKVLSDELECVDEEYLKRCVQAILRKAQEK